MELIKGKTSCNRTACQTELVDGAIYYNHSTDANYCPKCAYLINKHNPDLCILVKSPIINKEKHTTLINSLMIELQNMHPVNGLSSPRDIALANDINKLSGIIDEIKGKQ